MRHFCIILYLCMLHFRAICNSTHVKLLAHTPGPPPTPTPTHSHRRSSSSSKHLPTVFCTYCTSPFMAMHHLLPMPACAPHGHHRILPFPSHLSPTASASACATPSQEMTPSAAPPRPAQTTTHWWRRRWVYMGATGARHLLVCVGGLLMDVA